MTFAAIDLARDDGKSSATIVPERGAIATRFRVGARDVFYLDESTLIDETKNVRGGCPVLFPSPGKLTNDAWSRDGRSGHLKQHGFARNLAWKVERATKTDALLSLAATPETLTEYPWDFRAELRFVLGDSSLRIEQRVKNESDAPMPFGFGFHPYFAVPSASKAKARIPTRATRAWDNAAKKRIDFKGFDLTSREVDMHLLDHGATECSLVVEGTRSIKVSGSAEYTHWVVWTLEGKDFVCVEPWTCPGDALNTGDRVLTLARGESRDMFIEISVAQ
jgi:galactose mutarotase-like enzyme